MDFNQLLSQPSVQPYLMSARFGLEKESQRVDLNGQLAQSDHPQVLGDRSFHPSIQTDFAETQIELITPVRTSIAEVLRQLAMLHDVIYRSMPKEEMLWPFSMPPALPVSEEEIVIAKLKDEKEVAYRQYLAKVYGKRKQMVSGIHVNFEFGDDLLQALFAEQTEFTDFQAFKTASYLHLAQQYLHYRYIYTYFYGAAPYALDNYFMDDTPKQPVRSLRNSNYGYTNKETLNVSYESFTAYRQSLKNLVAQGKLIAEKEFYSAVRLRQDRQHPDRSAIKYLEFRNIDLNPFEANGINEEQLTFLQAFLLYLYSQKTVTNITAYLQAGEKANQTIALEHPLSLSCLQEQLQSFMVDFKAFILEHQLPIAPEFLEKWEAMIANPQLTLAGQMVNRTQTSPTDLAVQLGLAYQKQAWAHPYQLAGYREMELSTQILMFDAIQKGVQVEILDEQDQFIQLTYQGKTEYVKKANMTSKDCYVVPLMMENKVVTKKVLEKAGFNVPNGAEYHDFEQALADYGKYCHHAIVVKPKSTNYGLGITIFKEAFSQDDYKEALLFAFKEDQDVLVERFIEGTEYRFFVINQEVQGIMLRVPANVIGDGIHTISELVEQKNTDPLRGRHHRYPLEKIRLGEIEALNLKEQGYQFDDVLPKDKTVYLRENSNISTGGDSIDMTDAIGEDYKQIAVAATKALGAEICGMDLIIPDYHQPATNPDAYAIIEANFNPAMHMHAYPYQGKGRRLTLSVLQLLFPELTI